MLINELSIGAKVFESDSNIVFLVAAHEHPGYCGTTLISDCVLYQRCLDASEPDSQNKVVRTMGNAFYPESNLHGWLNSKEKDWFVPSHDSDVAPTKENVKKWPNMYDNESYNPYSEEAGFLSKFGQNFLDAVLDSDVAVYSPSKEKLETFKAKIFIPSTAELGVDAPMRKPEGQMLPLMRDFRMRYAIPSTEALTTADFRPANFTSHDSWFYWLRSAHLRNEGLCTVAHSSTPYVFVPAARPWVGVRVMLNIDSSLPVDTTAEKLVI